MYIPDRSANWHLAAGLLSVCSPSFRLTYPMTSGRNFDEALRLLDSLQLTAKQPVATPVNWKPGDDVIIVPSLSDEKAREKFPDGWKTLKPYLRIVPPALF